MNLIEELNIVTAKMSKIAEYIDNTAKSQLYDINVLVGEFCTKAAQDSTMKGQAKILIDKSISMDKQVSHLRDQCDLLHPDNLEAIKNIAGGAYAARVFAEVLQRYDEVEAANDRIRQLEATYSGKKPLDSAEDSSDSNPS